MAENAGGWSYIELTADIVSAFVSNNSVPGSEIPNLIGQVYAALRRVAGGQASLAEPPKPAVPIKRSVTAEYIICLEDGQKFKSLKRHLRTRYNMTPDQYREKWGLPPDYPWWPRIMPMRDRSSPSRWALASNGAGANSAR